MKKTLNQQSNQFNQQLLARIITQQLDISSSTKIH